jgi:tetratricopeptide (TPR) repeat protein
MTSLFRIVTGFMSLALIDGALHAADRVLRDQIGTLSTSKATFPFLQIDQREFEELPMPWLRQQTARCDALALQGKKGEAVALSHATVRASQERFGLADPVTNEALLFHGRLLKQVGRLAEAEEAYRQNLALLETKYGRHHLYVANAATRLGDLMFTLGKLDDAEALHRRALTIFDIAADEDRPDACLVLTNLAECLLAAGKKAEALPVMERAFTIVSRKDNPEVPSAGAVLRKQAEFYRRVAQLDRAEALARRAFTRLSERSESDRARVVYYDRVAEVYRAVLRDRGLREPEIAARLATVAAVEKR